MRMCGVWGGCAGRQVHLHAVMVAHAARQGGRQVCIRYVLGGCAGRPVHLSAVKVACGRRQAGGRRGRLSCLPRSTACAAVCMPVSLLGL